MDEKRDVIKSSVIVIDRQLMESIAYLKLTGNSKDVLIRFLGKRQICKIKSGKRSITAILNNGKIVFTYREAKEKYGISEKTFSRALDQLIKFGFIDIARPGIGYAKIETLYSISERWKDFGTDKFIEKKRTPRVNHKFPGNSK
ncbi:hypothetical protein JW960_21630 [candidate division KSB1 bacterium]|nr:hypothetical protein [candidate division KSB1 bacterium]